MQLWYAAIDPSRGLAAASLGRRQQGARHGSPEQHQPTYVKQYDQPAQEGQADREFDGIGRPPARGTPRQQWGQHEPLTVQPDAGEHLVKQNAVRSGERMAATIFLASRWFADDEGRAGGVALGEYEIAGGIAQGTPIEARKGFAQLIQVGGLAGKRRRPMRRRQARLVGRQGRDDRAYRWPRNPWTRFDRGQAVDRFRFKRLIRPPFQLESQQRQRIIQAGRS